MSELGGLLVLGFGLAGLAVLTEAIVTWIGNNARKFVIALLFIATLFVISWIAPGVGDFLHRALTASVCR